MLPRDFQLDVVTDKPVHVDFLRLRPGSRVRIAVPVHVVNREASPGVKKGGAVNLVMHSIELLAPADAIPEAVTVDLTGLDFQDRFMSPRSSCRRAAVPRIPRRISPS